MKSDLDKLMEQRSLDAIIVACDDNFSPPRDYLTGGVEITTGLIMKRRGDAPVIFANAMEIEEAAKSGLKVYTFNDLDWANLLEEYNGDRTKAEVIFWGRALEKIGVTAGKIGIYGVSDLNIIIELVRLLDKAYPQYQFVGELGKTLFDEAFVTKDADELKRMRDVARKTNDVMQGAWDYVRGGKVEGEALVHEDGKPFTIGDVKGFVRRALLDRGLEDTHMIFAQGRDGGFPHSRGEEDEQLRLGQPIVFDLFPREQGGGYFHDMTRTWCIGYAPPEVQQLYDQVMEAFDVAVEVARVGMPTKQFQEAVMDYFESKGHPTPRSNPTSMEGYVHSLGHGVGLKIHEKPNLSHLSKETLESGSIITIEPGLYYPERGCGMRIEDTFYVETDGTLVSLTDFHKDLVIPMG